MTIKAIVFDCDGVILESTGIKTSAFRALFEADHPDRVREIVNYHVRNMGISRHIKFRHICTEILGESYSPRKGAQLSRKFSELVVDRILACPLVKGARRFLRAQARHRALFVASGTPQAELEDILRRRGLLHLFEEVWGAPAQKPDVIRRVLRKGAYRHRELVFVGDAESDWRAARRSGVSFVRRLAPSAGWAATPCQWQIRDFRQLPPVLKALESALS